MSVMNINEIMEILPHRYPFLLVDAIEEIEPGKMAVGKKCVSMNEPFFQGHFPGNPVMPGVLIVEAMAQVGAVSMLSLDSYKGKTAYFAGIDKVRFRRKVIPGDVLIIRTEMVKVKGPMGIGVGKAYVNDELACEAELKFAIG